MHTLIVGITESGKTSTLKKIARNHLKQGFDVLVLTPIFEKFPEGCLIFTTQDEFLNIYWKSKRCIGIMDEGKQTANRFNEAMEATAERGRHLGHSNYYAGQRASQISPNIRNQCSQLLCFAQGQKDSDILAEEWNQEELRKAPDLRQGEYFLVRRFGDDGTKFCVKLNAFEETEI